MKTYSINDIIPNFNEPLDYYVGIFEDTPDPDIEWPHRHGFYSLVLFKQGSGINVIDFDEYDILPNRVFFINPMQIHNWSYSVDSRGYFLLIEEHLAKQANINCPFPFADVQVNDVNFIDELFKRMLSMQNQEIAIAYLFSLFDSQKDIFKTNDTIVEYKKLITENITESPTIEQYAEKLHISPEVLNSLCKNQTGLTAKQLQLDVKITEAKRLLLYSSFNASEIAFKVGFEDSSYFSRIFKKKTNLTPASFQEKYLNNRKKS